MSNLLHVVAIDRAIEGEPLHDADDVLGSNHCSWVVDSFENEREFYDVIDFLQSYFPRGLYDLVTSYGERSQPLNPTVELLRDDGWYVTVLRADEYETFKAGVIRALADRPWIEEVAPAGPPKDSRSLMQKIRGVATDKPKPRRIEHHDYPWSQFVESQVQGDYYVITSLK